MRAVGNRLVGGAVVAVWLVAALGVSAPRATAAGRFVSPAGSDAGNDCLEGLPLSARCATIQHAIDEAGAGDSVNVAPGVYEENLTIDKRLEVYGQAGVPEHWYEPETRIEGGSGTAVTVEASKVRITGFEIAATGTAPAMLVAGAGADELQVLENVISGGSAGIHAEAGGEKDMIAFNVIEGTRDGIRLSGTKYTDLSIRGNEFTAPIDEYALLADSTGTIEHFRMEYNVMAAPTRIAARVMEGQKEDEESEISGNAFGSTVGPQLGIDAAEVRIMGNSFDGHSSAGCLQILGSQDGLAPSEHVLVSYENEFLDCYPYGIELGPEVDRISIFGNEFPGSYDGVLLSGAKPWDVTEHVHIGDNRIVGTTHRGVENQASGTVDAERNWWGCNAGPGGLGCDRASSGVNADDNIILGALVGPRKEETGIIELPSGNSISLSPGEEAEVAAVLLTNGEGIVLGASTKDVPVGFSSSLGTFSPPSSTFQNGWTRSFFTAGSTPGEGSMVVSLDNQRTLVPVTVCCRPLETQRPSATPTAPARNRVTPKRHAVVASRRMTIGIVHCASACRVRPGRARVTIGGRRYRVKVTPRGVLGAETTATIRVALPGKVLRALDRAGKGSVKVTITVISRAGRISRAISVNIRT
jgi:hypothetical protein